MIVEEMIEIGIEIEKEIEEMIEIVVIADMIADLVLARVVTTEEDVMIEINLTIDVANLAEPLRKEVTILEDIDKHIIL